MLRHRIVELTSTPALMTTHEPVDRLNVLSIQNVMTTGFAYLGNSNVSATTYGHKLYPGQSFTIELAPNDRVWAVGDTGVSVAIFNLDIG